MQYILPILFITVLCAGWVVVQIIAKKMKTKNHFDNLNSSCGHCNCGGVEDNCSNKAPDK